LFVACVILAALACAFAALAGLLGFIWPSLDVFNHGQLIYLPLTFVGLVLAAASLRRQPARGLVVASLATGLVASVTIAAPEFIDTWAARPVAASDRPVIRLMTYNIYANNRALGRISDPIDAVDPDILVLQEFWPEFRDRLDPILDSRFPYRVRCQGGVRAYIALYSKVPFEIAPGQNCVDSPSHRERTAHIAVRFTEIGPRPFTVMTTHLDWPLPAERKRLQFAALSQDIATIPGPLLIAGDFNSTPFSQFLRNFARDNGLTRETHVLPTFPASDFFHTERFGLKPPLFLPLDQVMQRQGIRVLDVRLAPGAGGSDHFPVVVDFQVE
jgi:endonuclease/exonuclease/phosphatase (EEP) superfamily protein YafD